MFKVRGVILITIASLFMLHVDAAIAQESPSRPLADAPADSGCELHVWPGEKFKATTTNPAFMTLFGVVGGTIIDYFAFHSGDKRRRDAIQSLLNQEQQARIIGHQDVETLLAMPDVNVIMEKTPVELSRVWNDPTRLSDTHARCYGELIVKIISYHNSGKRQLRSAYVFRRFDPGLSRPHIYKGYGTGKLTQFGKHGKKGDNAASEADALIAFADSFRDFASNRHRID